MLLRFTNLLRRRAVAIAAGGACLLGAVAALTGGGAALDKRLHDIGDRVMPRAPSGQIVLVEIDSRSLREIEAWPWPRGTHGALVDRLRESGAERIGFDVDFSSPARDPEQDRLFAEAIERAGGRVVLPAILENADSTEGNRVDALPIAPLARHARIASIWMLLDPDFKARRIPYSVEIGGERRPTLSTWLVGRPDRREGSFALDWSVPPQAIPSISYSDVLNGRYPADFFAGKAVLIGATAPTLGDRVTVPTHGTIGGVYAHAIAAETLLRGASLPAGQWPALAFAGLLILFALATGSRALRAVLITSTALALLVAPFLVENLLRVSFGTGAALIALLAATVLHAGISLMLTLVSSRTRAAGTDLPNLAAMRLEASPFATTVAVRVRNHLELQAALGPAAQAALLRKVADRLSLAAGEASVFQVDDHSFAWRSHRGLDEELETLEGLHALFAGGMAIDGRNVDVNIALGLCTDTHLGVEQAVTAALIASDRSVQRGTSWGRYEPGDDEEQWRVSLLGEIDPAIERGDLWVAYQPQVRLDSGRIVGAEALARWTHPEHGDIRPELFVPILEENGRIESLTLHVLRQAVRDFSTLDESLSVSVNISMRVLGRARLLDALPPLLREFRFDPARLTLEITESAAISDPSHIAELGRLRALGVKISIDDFGTGQSTLSYLKTLPAEELKIDRSFVALVATSRSDATMVDSTVKLAHALGLSVVAEGVETQEVADILAGMECDYIQGFLTGRPTAFEEFVERVAGAAELPVRKSAAIRR